MKCFYCGKDEQYVSGLGEVCVDPTCDSGPMVLKSQAIFTVILVVILFLIDFLRCL